MPLENDIKDLEAIQNASEVDARTKMVKCDKEHRGPAPLQRSPVMDNVALKALAEEHHFKLKEDCIAEDIIEQLNSISLLTKQHMSEKGLVRDCNDENGSMHKNDENKITQLEKLHTLKYKSGILNASDKQIDNIQNKDGCSTGLICKDNNGDPGSEIETEQNGVGNVILTIKEAQAQQTVEKSSDIDATLHEVVQKNQNTVDAYTPILKTKSNEEPLKGAQLNIRTLIGVPATAGQVEERDANFADALVVMSSEGQGLPYIDEPRGKDTTDNVDSVAGQLWSNSAIEGRILPSVKEDSGIIFPQNTISKARSWEVDNEFRISEYIFMDFSFDKQSFISSQFAKESINYSC